MSRKYDPLEEYRKQSREWDEMCRERNDEWGREHIGYYNCAFV